MSATEREIRLRIVATEMECNWRCGGAKPYSDKCRWFRKKRQWNEVIDEYIRLPECIAAEGAGREGGERC